MATQPTPDSPDLMPKANELINKWAQENFGLPVTVSLNQLGFAVIEALDDVYKLGWERGWNAAEQELRK